MAARLLDDADGEAGADDRLEDEELGGDVDMDEGAVGEEGAVGLLLDLGVAQQHALKTAEEDIRIRKRSEEQKGLLGEMLIDLGVEVVLDAGV